MTYVNILSIALCLFSVFSLFFHVRLAFMFWIGFFLVGRRCEGCGESGGLNIWGTWKAMCMEGKRRYSIVLGSAWCNLPLYLLPE